MICKVIETDRLILKVLDESHAAEVLAFYEKNKCFLKPWEAYRHEKFFTLETQRVHLRLDGIGMQKGDMVRYWIYEKGSKNTDVMGTVSITNIIRGVFKSCYLGYKISEDKAGQGLMYEAVTAVVDLAFNQLKLHRIEANIMPHNIASIRMISKCGFVNEGLARKYLMINGKWEDHIHFVKINDDLEG